MCRSWQGVLTCRRRVGFVNKSNWRCHEGSRPSSTAIVFFTPGLGVDRAITRYCSSSSKEFLRTCVFTRMQVFWKSESCVEHLVQMGRIFTIIFFWRFIFGAITRYCSSEAFLRTCIHFNHWGGYQCKIQVQTRRFLNTTILLLGFTFKVGLHDACFEILKWHLRKPFNYCLSGGDVSL